jgi:hypothetical protein
MTWHPGDANLSNFPHVPMTPLFVCYFYEEEEKCELEQSSS